MKSGNKVTGSLADLPTRTENFKKQKRRDKKHYVGCHRLLAFFRRVYILNTNPCPVILIGKFHNPNYHYSVADMRATSKRIKTDWLKRCQPRLAERANFLGATLELT